MIYNKINNYLEIDRDEYFKLLKNINSEKLNDSELCYLSNNKFEICEDKFKINNCRKFKFIKLENNLWLISEIIYDNWFSYYKCKNWNNVLKFIENEKILYQISEYEI